MVLPICLVGEYKRPPDNHIFRVCSEQNVELGFVCHFIHKVLSVQEMTNSTRRHQGITSARNASQALQGVTNIAKYHRTSTSEAAFWTNRDDQAHLQWIYVDRVLPVYKMDPVKSHNNFSRPLVKTGFVWLNRNQFSKVGSHFYCEPNTCRVVEIQLCDHQTCYLCSNCGTYGFSPYKNGSYSNHTTCTRPKVLKRREIS